MLSAIRAFAKTPLARILFALVILSFGIGIWNGRNAIRDVGASDAVVKAPGRPPITQDTFKQIFTRQLQAQQQQTGQALTAEDAVKRGLDRYLVDRLAATESLAALMQVEGVVPSQPLIDNEVRKIKAFFDPVTGRFDKDQYRRQLAESHITPEVANAEFRDEVAQRHYIAGMAAGLKAPRIYGLVQAAYEKQGADFAWFALPSSAVEAPKPPSEADMAAFLKANAAQLTKPELRQLSLASFSAAKLAQTIQAPEADVQKRFDFEKDTLSQPEKRTVIEVVVKDAAAGEKVSAQLKAGGDPMTIAKAVGGTALSYPSTPKAQIADRKMAEAAFAMRPGEVSGPIHGDLSLAVVKVVDVTPGKPATLAEARPKIETEIKQQLAKAKVYDQVQKYEDAHSSGAQLADAAKAAGVEVTTLPAPITAQGGTIDGRRVNMPPKVLQTAFSLSQGGESQVIDLGQGEYWVVHVDKVIPPALLGLDEQVVGGKVRDLLGKQMVSQELYKRLKAKADGLVDAVKKGKSFEAAAAEAGGKVVQAANVTRAAAQATVPGQPPAYTPDLLGRLFQAKPGDIVLGADTKPGVIIAKLGRFQEPDAPILAGYAEALRIPTTRGLFNDLNAETDLAAQHRIKPKVDLRQARRALGIASDADGKPSS